MTRKITPSNLSLKSRKGRASNMIRLVVIFVVAASATVAAHLVFGRVAGAETTPAELEQARREAQGAIPRLPTDTEDRLAAALYPQLAPITNISDPFVDRAGVAGANGSVSPTMVR